MSYFIFALVLWIALNFAAPLSVMAMSRRMTVANLPGEILYHANQKRVRYYRANLSGGYAFTIWSWPYKIVVIDDQFLKQAPPAVIRFVLAHELGHCIQGHTLRRWLALVSGAILLPQVRRYLDNAESSADEYAEELSGVSRKVLRGEVQP